MMSELYNTIAGFEQEINEELHTTGCLADITDKYNELQKMKAHLARIESENPNPRLVDLFGVRLDGVSSKFYNVFNLWTGKDR